VLIQPAHGYNIDPKSTYHDPALVPQHAYFAAYTWLAEDFRADAVIHLGKHGTLEWLPGKALALSAECFPRRCWHRCRISTHSSSTTREKAPKRNAERRQ
jgi:cobaltochelatase CobN